MLRRKHCSAKTKALKTSPPWGFTKVEYLEKTGNQFIDTNYGGVCTANITVSLEGTTGNAGWNGWGAPNSQYNSRGSVWWLSANEDGQTIKLSQYAMWDIIPTDVKIGEPVNITHWHGENMEQPTNTGAVIGIRIKDKHAWSWKNGDIDATQTYKLFTRDTPYKHEKLYSFKLSKNNTLLRDMLPFLDETKTPCMFDKVTRKRFYNAGTGEFLTPLHKDFNNYTPVEYLESQGQQYIIPWDGPLGDLDVEATFFYRERKNYAYVFARQNGWSDWSWNRFAPTVVAYLEFYDTGKIYRNTESSLYDFKTDRIYHVKVSKNAFYVDGEKVYQFEPTDYRLDWKRLALFAYIEHVGGAESEESFYQSAIRCSNKVAIYNFKIGDKINFIPALDPTGTPCMFDTVTQTPYYNAGTGDFLYPSPTSSTTYSMRRPQAEYAKMTDTGVRRLYHVPVDYEGSIEEYVSENGFKLLNETDSPNEEGKYYAFRWVETDTELTTEWYETEPPTDEFGQVIENNNEQQSTTFNLRRPVQIDNTVYSNNAQWAKITDTGVHKIYHTPIGYEGSLEDYAVQNNYKRLIETKSPNEEGKHYSFKWVETDDSLTTEWFEIDPPQEEIIEENLDNPTE